MDAILLEFVKENLVTIGLALALARAVFGDNKLIQAITAFLERKKP